MRAAVSAGRLALAGGDGAPADAVISGSPLALLELLAGGARREGSAAPDADARRCGSRGDAEIAARYRELFAAGAARLGRGAVAARGRSAGAAPLAARERRSPGRADPRAPPGRTSPSI